MKLMLDNDLFDRQDRPQSKRLMAALKGKDLRGLTPLFSSFVFSCAQFSHPPTHWHTEACH